MQIDTTTEFGKRVERRLREEQIIWLTTVRQDGTPQPLPVWFLWEGDTILIYSQPNQQKLRNIRGNPHVSLNFDGNGHGGDIIVLTGTAAIAEDAPRANAVPEYVAKYGEGIKRIGLDPDKMADTYSVPVRVTLTGLRGH